MQIDVNRCFVEVCSWMIFCDDLSYENEINIQLESIMREGCP